MNRPFRTLLGAVAALALAPAALAAIVAPQRQPGRHVEEAGTG